MSALTHGGAARALERGGCRCATFASTDRAFASRVDSGVPTKIAWKPFYSNLPPPARIHGRERYAPPHAHRR